jgi:hypothetical protein
MVTKAGSESQKMILQRKVRQKTKRLEKEKLERGDGRH